MATQRNPGHDQMLELLAEIRKRTPDENPFFGDALLREYRAKYDAILASAPTAVRGSATIQLADAELNDGGIERAIQLLQHSIELIEQTGSQMDMGAWCELNYRLGFAWLRLAETQNCCLRHTPESCIVPIQKGGVHSETKASETAIDYFRRTLDARRRLNNPQQRDLFRHMKCQWLLNIAYMTLGRYPDGVPREYLVMPHVFTSTEQLPRFRNIAPRLGIDTFNLAGGMVVDDFDGDEDLDMVTSSFDTSEALRYFENKGDGTFHERSKEAGFSGLLGGLNLVQADYDDDGDLDLLVLRGGWFGAQGRHPNSLLRNNGRGVFEDVTIIAGLGRVHFPTQTAGWADYDNDGDLDLYIGNETSAEIRAPCQLFRNQGDGTFVDVGSAAGVANEGMAKGVSWGDYDHDRWPDLAVSNKGAANRLYHNNGDGTFSDVTESAGVANPTSSFPLWFWDFDNDGKLDLFISSWAAEIVDVVAYYAKLPSRVEPPGHYRGDGAGGFVNVCRQHNFDYPMLPMGSNFGDLNNDGFLDVYLGTGQPDISVVLPNLMFLNKGGAGFTDVTMSGGFGHLQKGHAVCFADFDHDGDQDVFEQMGGARPVDKYADALYENPGLGGHWIVVRLVGRQSNSWGVGARIHVRIAEVGGKERSIYRHVNSGGSFGANPLRQHIGLGNAQRIVRLEVYWPTSDTLQVLREAPTVDSYVVIEEGREGFEYHSLRQMSLPSNIVR